MVKKIITATAIAVSLIGSAAFAGTNDKVSVCHVTHSSTNQTVLIRISENAVDVHLQNGDYLLPVGATDCSGGGGLLPRPDEAKPRRRLFLFYRLNDSSGTISFLVPSA